MFYTDIITISFLCFIIIFIALCYFLLYHDTEYIIQYIKPIKLMNKQVNNKNARDEIARFYCYDKNIQSNQNESVIMQHHEIKHESFGSISMKSMKPSDRQQQRYSLQQISSYQLNEYENKCLESKNHRIKLKFDMNTPLMNITKPQMVQPDNRIFLKKNRLIRAFSESSTTKLDNNNNNEINVTKQMKSFNQSVYSKKLSDTNLDKQLHRLSCPINSNRTLFHSQKSISSSSNESIWFEVKRRLSNTEKIFDPFMRILSTIPMKSQINLDNTWTNLTINSNNNNNNNNNGHICFSLVYTCTVGTLNVNNGHICFSLVYTCTVGTLNVTINRLTGVSNLIKNTNYLPSQTPTNYVVGLRLRHNRTSFIYKDEKNNEVDRMNSINNNNNNNNNNGFCRKYFTQPILTSLNPSFDESFVFPLTLNELKNAELVLTVLQSTTMQNEYINLNEKILPRRNHSVTSYSYPYTSEINRISRRMKMISEEMRCIGVTFYKLNQHELINCPEKMQNIWQELRKLPEVQSRQMKTTDCLSNDSNNSTFPINDSTNYELYPFNLVNENNKFDELQCDKTMLNPNSNIEQNDDWKQSMIKVTILYKMKSSILEIFIEELRNFKIFKDETEIIIQALFCLGNTTLSIVKSKPYQIIKTKFNEINIESNETFTIYDHIRLCNNEYISLNIDINRLLNFSNIGIILQLFIRTNTSNQMRRLANLSIGMTKLTYDLAIQQWNDLINELKQLKNDKLYDGITKKITYWHIIDSY
ncbi:hypothetical protein MN116_000822 [Schistosoma mekongi]|uniref:C2 domain-containing protein n=1 Tax=Schistosoma mekongi TaxID=38744 RepID=A0AAE2D8S0_SCHME|nr:hypothetical protein MN116_000822 [Schistosoma mekongi]